MKSILVFIDGTICDMRQRIDLIDTDEFYSDENIMKDTPTLGAVEMCNELSKSYSLIYIGAGPSKYTDITHKWLLVMGFPDGETYLGDSQEERMTIVKSLKTHHDFTAGIGDRWDDNELHNELGCQSFILKEWQPNWDTVRKYLRK